MAQIPAQPREYRLHIFDGAYEVLHARVHVVVLDFNRPGYVSTLNSQLAELTRQAEAAGEIMEHPRLEVRDAEGRRVRDWTGA